jgi:hypothetical protein
LLQCQLDNQTIKAGGSVVPRYVILEHDFPSLHWDFMLEAGAVLRTWRLAAPPEPGQPVQAAASFDHRLVYLDYEGPVSGNRGQVQRWDAGTFDWLSDQPGRLALRLDGGRLQGTARLEEASPGEWLLTMEVS